MPSFDTLTPEVVHGYVLGWYDRDHRDLPWRATRDPYAVLVSEIMLQQTQVDRVLPKYAEFLSVFPTLADLARASRAEVITRWSPLGYNLRAVRLHEIARQAVERFGGRLPSTVEELTKLKGLGRYTASAVACFAFERRVPILDTNVRRVLGRVFDGEDAPRTPAGERRGWELAEYALPADRYYDWNQALMDLGATVCTARKPACLMCPARDVCRYVRERRTGTTPVQSKSSSDGSPPTDADVIAPAAVSVAAERRATYRAAGAFVGSNRYYRGRIVEALRGLDAGRAISLDALGPSIKPDYTPDDQSWLVQLVEGLARDGLVEVVEATGIAVRLPV